MCRIKSNSKIERKFKRKGTNEGGRSFICIWLLGAARYHPIHIRHSPIISLFINPLSRLTSAIHDANQHRETETFFVKRSKLIILTDC